MGSNKHKVSNRLGFNNRVGYKLFIKSHPKSDITYEQYKTIIKESNSTIVDFILTNELGFKLPYNLGYLAVDKYTPSQKRIRVDWANTRKYGKVIPYTNLHSLGYVYKVRLLKNRSLSIFKAFDINIHRSLNRKLAQYVKNGQNYLHLEESYYNKRFRIERFIKKQKYHG